MLRAVAGNAVMAAIIGFALETALRRREIAYLTWACVNLASRTALISTTKTGIPRTVPLSSKAAEVLQKCDKRSDGLVFGVRPDSITQAFERACRRAQISNLRFHDLRHEATTRLFEKGLTHMEVSAITGHRDLRMLHRYTHLRPELIARKLDN